MSRNIHSCTDEGEIRCGGVDCLTIRTGASELKVVSDVAQLFVVAVQLECRAGDVVVLLHLVVKRRVREVRVGRIQQRTCTESVSSNDCVPSSQHLVPRGHKTT